MKRNLIWMMRVLILCAMLGMNLGVARAEGDADGNPSPDKAGLRLPPRDGGHDAHAAAPRGKSSSATSGLWTTVISLAAIIGCLLLVGHWLRPYIGAPRGLSVEALELLGRRVIDQKVAIHLVRCGGRVLVLSVSPEGARTLSEISDPEEVRRLIDACNSPANGTKRGTDPESYGDDSNTNHNGKRADPAVGQSPNGRQSFANQNASGNSSGTRQVSSALQPEGPRRG